MTSVKNSIMRLPGAKWCSRRLAVTTGLLGHRSYVGGCWDEIGKLQFDFMLKEGLKPEHYFLDVACGSLRAGLHFIPYLEVGHYPRHREGKEVRGNGREDLTRFGRFELTPYGAGFSKGAAVFPLLPLRCRSRWL